MEKENFKRLQHWFEHPLKCHDIYLKAYLDWSDEGARIEQTKSDPFGGGGWGQHLTNA